MDKITSVNNNLIKELNNLKNKKHRLDNKLFLIEGLHLVEEASKANRLQMVLSDDEETLKRFKNAKCYLVTKEVIKKLSTTVTPQNIIGVANILANNYQKADKYIVLDNVADPGNLGTILRTSAALGVTNILMSKTTVDCYNEKVVRATQGAIFKVNIVVDELENIYTFLKQNQIPVITTSLKAKKDLKDLDRLTKYALVLGNEASGISEISNDASDEAIIIPLQNDVESLNVAMTLGIVLYQLEHK